MNAALHTLTAATFCLNLLAATQNAMAERDPFVPPPKPIDPALDGIEGCAFSMRKQ